MIRTETARAARAAAAPPAPPAPAVAPSVRLVVYGCGPDEAALFRALGPSCGLVPAIIEEQVGTGNAGAARGVACVSVGHKERVTNATLLALRDAGVRYVSTRSVGCNHIDVEFAANVGIVVEPVAYSPDSVADYTLMLMLMAVRHAKAVMRRVDAHDYRLQDTRGRELRDLTVGVIGTGRIGVAVVERLRGFGCRVLAHDRRPQTVADAVPLAELLRQSDIVTLHTPLTAATHHLLDRARLRQLKQGAVVVNTGRGALVDTAALVPLLESGRLGGAALDVLEGEDGIFYADRREDPVRHELLLRLHALPNVVITPHTAYFTDHALRDTVESSIANCLAFAGGDRHA